MFDSVKEVLNKDVNPKEIKKYLEMEVEIKQLKVLLETEVKLKEILLQEVDVKTLLTKRSVVTDSVTNSEEKKVDRREAGGGRKDDNLRIDSDRRISFGRRKSDEPKKSFTTLPAYDLSLIQTIEKSHKELLFIYESIMLLAKEKEYKRVASQLTLFSEEFNRYFHLADQQLYSYLKIYINVKQPKRKKAFAALNLEMKNLYLSIYYSLHQSPNIPIKDETFEGFISEFSLLGEQLKARFEREDKVIMKMYKESHQIEDISNAEMMTG